MIYRYITNYSEFKTVMSLPEGLRKHRSLWRLEQRQPEAYKEFMERYQKEQEPEPEEQKPKRGRRKKAAI